MSNNVFLEELPKYLKKMLTDPKMSFTKLSTAVEANNFENYTLGNLALDLTMNKDIPDFKISSNDNRFGIVDDIVVEIDSFNKRPKLYAMQLKYANRKNAILTRNSLSSSRGDFSLKKYYDNYIKLKEEIGAFKSILYTNRSLDYSLQTKKRNKGEQAFTPSLIDLELTNNDIKFKVFVRKKSIAAFFEDTNPNCSCFEFEIEETANLPDLEQYKDFFKNFSLYVTNKCNNDIQSDIIEKFHNKLGEPTLSKTASRNYINFISQWSIQGGKKHKLNKQFMKSVIGIFLTEIYIKPLVFNAAITEKQRCFRQIIEEFSCTIVHPDKADAIRAIWSDKLLPNQKIVSKLCNFFQFSFTNDDLVKTKILWILNRSPLIVQDHEMTRQAKKLCESSEFIFLIEDFDNFVLDQFSIFRCLYDITDKSLLDRILTNFYCDLQGSVMMLKHLASLDIDDKMYNQEILKIITTSELIEMTHCVMKIGYHKNEGENFYIERSLSHNTFEYNILKNIDSSTKIIISCLNETKKLKLRFSNIQFIDIDKIEEHEIIDASRQEAVVFISKKEFSQKSFDNLTARNNMKTWHQLRYVDEKYLEYVRSSIKPTNLKPLLRKNEMILETELFKFETDSNINIICGEPGMGKTTLMKNLCTQSNSKTNIYFTVVVYVKNLNNFQQSEDLRDYLIQKWAKEYENSKFDFKLLQLFINMSRIRYLWDGIDEVSKETLDALIQKIHVLVSEGSIHWLTSRTNLTTFLEKEFNILSKTILPFTENDQKSYMQHRLINIREDINDIHKKIKENSKHFSYDILGIPVQINILTELLIPESNFMNLKNGLFSTTYLYDKLIDARFDKYQKSYDSPNNFFNEFKTTRMMNYRKLAAHKYLNITNIDCKEFINTIINNNGDPVGLLIQDEQNNNLDFLHASFGEFFAACYILEMAETIPPIKIFDIKSRNIRLFLDLKAAEDCKAHRAVLYKNWPYVRSCPDFERTKLDKLKRNIIQLFCSWGPSFPDLNDPKKIDNNNKCLFCKDKKGIKYIIRRIDNLEIDLKIHKEYIESFEDVLKKWKNSVNNMYGIDNLFGKNCYSYGENSKCFLSLGILIAHESFNSTIDADITLPLIIYSCALFDYYKILDKCKPIPYIEISLSNNNAVRISFLQEIVESNAINFLKKIIEEKLYKQMFEENKNIFLSIACANDFYKIAELCINHGANIEFINEHEFRPLHLACQSNSLKIVNLLIENHVNIEASAGVLKERPLHIACSIGAFRIVSLLVTNNAELNVPNREFNCPIHLACQKGSYEIVELLLTEGVAANKRNRSKKLPIEMAWNSEAFHIVQYFIENEKHGATLNMYCMQFIHLACEFNNYNLAELIIKKKVNINIPNKKGNRPIHIACENNAFMIVNLLISSGNGSLDYLNAKGKTALDIACENGYLQVVKAIVPHLNNSIKSNNTCLYTAWKNKQYEIVTLLINNEININKPDIKGNTLLHYASEEGNLPLAKLLLDKNIDFTKPNNIGKFPIHLAWNQNFSNKYNKKHYEIIELLIQNKVNVSAIDENGNTFIHLACIEGAYKLLQLLLESGSSSQLQIENKFKEVPLLLATRNGDEKIVELLLIVGANHNAEDRDGNTALHIACQNGSIQIVQKLIARNVDAEKSNKSGSYPIHVAWENQHFNIVHFLIANSINIAVFDSENNAPIHLVCKEKLLSSLKLLTELGVEIEVSNGNKMRPIHFACLSGSNEITKIIINAGANVEAKDISDNAPIHFACLSTSNAIVKTLIDSNVNLQCRNKEGEMPIHIACRTGASKIVELLIKEKVDITCPNDFTKDTPLHLACKSKSSEIVNLLIHYNAKVNVFNEYGEMPIHIACAVNSYEIVEMLIRAKSKLNEKNYINDDRPIHVACKSNAIRIVLQLIEKKVSCNVYNKNGDSPLHIACRNGSLDIVRQLLTAGANAFRANYNKHSPMDLAKQGQYKNICELLTEPHLAKNSSITFV